MRLMSVSKKTVCVLLLIHMCIVMIHAAEPVASGNTPAIEAQQEVPNPVSSAAIPPAETVKDEPSPTTPAANPTTNPPANTPNPTPANPTPADPTPVVSTPKPAATSADKTTNAATTTKANNPSKTTDNESTDPDSTNDTSNNNDKSVNPSTAGPSSATPTKAAAAKEEKSDNKTAIIVGSVVGGIVGLAFVGGIMAWINRRGGCTARTKNRGNGFTEEDYTVNMNQNDFNHPAPIPSPAAVNSTLSTEPLSPFDQHRYAPTSTNTANYTSEPYQQEYHDVYRQDGYTQDMYSNTHGYYDNTYNAQPAYVNGHEYPAATYDHYQMNPTAATTVSNGSDPNWNQQMYQTHAVIPNPRDYNKPNEM
ncbi:hypothetical protein BDB01DRAFT_800060 [Pilobolus umbonatus]|nr:hypothetical protein BDB01DRAFT_800060 [Pilobolus umbonatus]